jgi:hypothetical protein
MDLSGANGSDPLETIGGFTSLMHANAFARAYVRDSFERCRAPGLSHEEVLSAWFAYGEDAVVDDEAGWKSANELHDFAQTPAAAEERDWRSLDPRRDADDDEDDEDEDQTG